MRVGSGEIYGVWFSILTRIARAEKPSANFSSVPVARPMGYCGMRNVGSFHHENRQRAYISQLYNVCLVYVWCTHLCLICYSGKTNNIRSHAPCRVVGLACASVDCVVACGCGSWGRQACERPHRQQDVIRAEFVECYAMPPNIPSHRHYLSGEIWLPLKFPPET